VNHAHLITFGDPDAHLVLVRLDLATGNDEGALARLISLIEDASVTKRWAELVPLLVWQALAQHRLGDETRAVASLKEAVRLGKPGGFTRSFLTPGHDLRPLLDRTKNHLSREEIAYLRRTPWLQSGLGAAGVQEDATAAASASASELLSQREIEVLTLLERGFTNPQIAEHLFVSMGTVKKHVSGILRKLGVSNRTAAVRQSRQ
jgi:LuxR family maltose regulon positive regulatory protein